MTTCDSILMLVMTATDTNKKCVSQWQSSQASRWKLIPLQIIAPDGTHTNRIESSWRPFKQWMRNYRMNSNDDDQFILLLCEYYWRRFCRIGKIDKFNDLLRGIKQLYPGNPLQ